MGAEEEMAEICTAENGAVVDADAGGINEEHNWNGEGEGGDVILSQLLLYAMMDDYEYETDKYYDRNIYNDGNYNYITDQEYHDKYGCIVWTVTSEVNPYVHN